MYICLVKTNIMTNLDKLRIEVGITSIKQAKECLTDIKTSPNALAISHYQNAAFESDSLEATRLALESIRLSVGVEHPKYHIVNILYKHVQ